VFLRVRKNAPERREAPIISEYSGWLVIATLGAQEFQVLGAIAWEGKGQAFGFPWLPLSCCGVLSIERQGSPSLAIE